MFAGSLMLVGSVFLVSYFNTPQARADNHCLTNEPPRAFHIVLVDKTDLFGENFTAQIKEFILRKAKSIGMDERLAVFEIRGTHNKRFPPVVSLCNPGRGVDYNKLFFNRDKRDKIFQEEYLQTFEKAVDDILSFEESPRSPVLEVIEDITTRSEVHEVKGEKTITLISDMAQNSGLLRFVRDREPVTVSEDQIERAIAEIAGTKGLQFHGFSFEIYQVEEAYDQPVLDHVETTWESIIVKSGGKLAHWGDL